MNKNTKPLTLLGSRKSVEDAIDSEQARSRCPSHGCVRSPVRDGR